MNNLNNICADAAHSLLSTSMILLFYRVPSKTTSITSVSFSKSCGVKNSTRSGKRVPSRRMTLSFVYYWYIAQESTHPDKVQTSRTGPHRPREGYSSSDWLDSISGLAELRESCCHARRLTYEERQVALGKPPLSCVRRPSSRITALNGVRRTHI